jgi:starvation-inducible DNA-binding protein
MKSHADTAGSMGELARGLSGMLADSYVLYNTTQFCHWNVEGEQFHALHAMFEAQYIDLAQAVDLVAERIRVLGFYTPGTLSELIEASRIRQEPRVREAKRMLEELIAGHQTLVERIGELIELGDERVDEATADLLVERLRIHEKTVWMLKSQAGHRSETLEASPPQPRKR